MSEVDRALLRGRKLAGQGSNRWQRRALRHGTGGGRALVRDRIHDAGQEAASVGVHNLEVEEGCGWVMQTVRQQGERANDVRERMEAIGQQRRQGGRGW